MLGDVSQVGKALQSLKHQLNLPTHTVRSQNVRRRTAGEGRKHDHVFSKFEGVDPADLNDTASGFPRRYRELFFLFGVHVVFPPAFIDYKPAPFQRPFDASDEGRGSH